VLPQWPGSGECVVQLTRISKTHTQLFAKVLQTIPVIAEENRQAQRRVENGNKVSKRLYKYAETRDTFFT
jgi:hypothetical protein